MEPHIANHATHFLRRLDRVTEGHLELAMALYTDHELLRLVLNRAKLPEGAERLAIALGPVHEGPFVVVTRTGAFVTCLGKNMRPKNLPIVRRAELESAAQHLERMRERLDRVRQLREDLDEQSTLQRLRQIDLSRTSLPREDFEELARWDALVGESMHLHLIEMMATCMKSLPTVAAIPRRKRSAAGDELLAGWWRAFWTASNLHVLANTGDVHARCASFEQQAKENAEKWPTAVMTSLFVAESSPLVQTQARAIWTSLRHVEATLEHLEAPIVPSLTPRMLRDATLTTIALGSHVGRARALSRLRHATPDPALEAEVTPFFRDAIRDPERAFDEYTLYAQELVAQDHGGDPREIPGDVARAKAVTSMADTRVDPFARQLLARSLPWVAAADASELFVPRAWSTTVPYTRDNALALVRSVGGIFECGPAAPARRIESPERNERCACGSGQKYKRCCMRTPMRIAA